MINRSSSRLLVFGFLSVIWSAPMISWAIQIGRVTSHLLKLGLPTQMVPIVWIAGPVTGMVVQPLVSDFSDRYSFVFGKSGNDPYIQHRKDNLLKRIIWPYAHACLSGKRRPIMIPACLLMSIMLLLISRTTSAVLAAVYFMFLDLAINAYQGPARALVCDLISNRPAITDPESNGTLDIINNMETDTRKQSGTHYAMSIRANEDYKKADNDVWDDGRIAKDHAKANSCLGFTTSLACALGYSLASYLQDDVFSTTAVYVFITGLVPLLFLEEEIPHTFQSGDNDISTGPQQMKFGHHLANAYTTEAPNTTPALVASTDLGNKNPLPKGYFIRAFEQYGKEDTNRKTFSIAETIPIGNPKRDDGKVSEPEGCEKQIDDTADPESKCIPIDSPLTYPLTSHTLPMYKEESPLLSRKSHNKNNRFMSILERVSIITKPISYWALFPPYLKRAFAAQCFSYVSWFCVYIYAAEWVVTSTLRDDEIDVESSGNREFRLSHANGSLAMCSLFSCLVTMIIPSLEKKIPLRVVWSLCILVLSGVLMLMSTSSRYSLSQSRILLMMLGIPMASAKTIPWIFVSRASSELPSQVYHARISSTFNLSQCFPEIFTCFFSFFTFYVDSRHSIPGIFHTRVEPISVIMFMGALSAVLAAYLAIKV